MVYCRHRSIFGDHPDPLTCQDVPGRSRQRGVQPLFNSKSKSRCSSYPPRVLWQALVEEEEEEVEEGLRPGPRLDLVAALRLDPVAEVARLKAQAEPAHLKAQGEVVRLQLLSEPVPHEGDPNKLKNNHVDEDEDKLKNDLDVPTRLRPSHGPDTGPRLKGPPVPLSTKLICNDDCACCYKTKNKLPQDDASPTSPPPTVL